jgi:putative oxidoreductase
VPIASASKWLFGALIMTLIDEGQLSLDEARVSAIAAFGLVCQMLGALFLVHVPQGHSFVSQSGPSYELALVYFVVAILLIALGPGKWSLDARLFAGRSIEELRFT